MHCIIYAAHQRCITPKMHPAKDASEQGCITPKMQGTKDAAYLRYIIPKIHHTKDAFHQRYNALRMQCSKESPHQRCIAPEMHQTKDIISDFRFCCTLSLCTYPSFLGESGVVRNTSHQDPNGKSYNVFDDKVGCFFSHCLLCSYHFCSWSWGRPIRRTG